MFLRNAYEYEDPFPPPNQGGLPTVDLPKISLGKLSDGIGVAALGVSVRLDEAFIPRTTELVNSL
jgi:hypothetical protein